MVLTGLSQHDCSEVLQITWSDRKRFIVWWLQDNVCLQPCQSGHDSNALDRPRDLDSTTLDEIHHNDHYFMPCSSKSFLSTHRTLAFWVWMGKRSMTRCAWDITHADGQKVICPRHKTMISQQRALLARRTSWSVAYLAIQKLMRVQSLKSKF